MPDFSRQLGNRGFGSFGRMSYQQPETTPGTRWVPAIDSFAGGYDRRDSKEDTAPNSSPNALDVEVSVDDQLQVVPGTTLVETLTGKTPQQVFLQASLDHTSELVFIDPPYVGVKFDAATSWQDAELIGTAPFSATNFGGALLFSNGRLGLYAREANSTTVPTLVVGAPAASVVASFAGRVFVANAVINGNHEPLGIAWSAATSDYKDWDQFDTSGAESGAGNELLIDSLANGDAVLAMLPMGLDLMAIVLRRSIWIASRTGIFTRPADFRPRVPGIGAVSAASCQVTRYGVVMLSDGGYVYLFDGNEAQWISPQVTPELGTLTRTQLAACTSAYNVLRRAYYLFTPLGTFIYDFELRRWSKRSALAFGGVPFATQFHRTTWAEITGTWADQAEVWQDLKPEEAEDTQFYMLGTQSAEATLVREDSSATAAFGVALTPRWDTPTRLGDYSNQLVTVKQAQLMYSAGGSVQLWLPDGGGNFQLVKTLLLGGRPPAVSMMEHTGLGVGVRLVLAGHPSISRLQLGIIPRGPRIEGSLKLVSSGLLLDENFALQADGTPLSADWDLSQSGQLVPATVQGGALQFLLFGGNSKFVAFRTLTGLTSTLVWQLRYTWPVGKKSRLNTPLAIRGTGGVTFVGQKYWGFFTSNTEKTWTFYYENDDSGNFKSGNFVNTVAPVGGVEYPIKIMLGNPTRALVPGGGVASLTPTELGLVPERLVMNSTSVSGAGVEAHRISRASAMISNVLTCSGVQPGWLLRVDGVDGTAAVGSVASWDVGSFAWPATSVSLVDAAGNVVASLSPAGGLWGGSVLVWS